MPEDRSRHRWRAPVLLAVGVTVLTGALAVPLSRQAPAADAAAGASRAAAVVIAGPRSQVQVQKWLLAQDDLRIELNDLLVPFVQGRFSTASDAKTVCQRLQVVTAKLNGLSKAPDARVDPLARAGWTQFASAAKTCLTGDLAGATTSVKVGLAERQKALHPLDSALEGDGD